jgi:hypothetical protein
VENANVFQPLGQSPEFFSKPVATGLIENQAMDATPFYAGPSS